MVVWAADANLKYSFGLEGSAVLGVGVACGHPARKDEEGGEGEEFTKASVEEDIVSGENALLPKRAMGDGPSNRRPLPRSQRPTPNV